MPAGSVLWYRFVLWVVRWLFFGATGGMRIKGRKNIPWQGPLIVAPNHTSNLDPPATACAIHRQVTFMAKADLFRVPIFGALIRSLGSFAVHRGEADTEAVRLALKLLGEGKAVLVFPEGTRGDGRTMLPVNRGVALLAKRSGAPVLPVGIAGTHRKMPRGKSFPKFGRVTVAFGEPFLYSDVAAHASEAENREAFAVHLESRILALCAQAGLELKAAESCPRPSTTDGPAEPSETSATGSS